MIIIDKILEIINNNSLEVATIKLNQLYKDVECKCPLESTDVYDSDGKYLGHVCLGCEHFTKY